MSTAVQPSTSQASTSGSTSKPATNPSTTARKGIKIESKPIQWATSTGATVLQHLAAQREQGKLRNANGTTLNRDDLINSKPTESATSTTKARSKGSNGSGSSAKNGNGNKTTGPIASSRPSSSPSSSTTSTTIAKAKTVQPITKENGKTNSDSTEKPARRRKANRACSHCQKAHLTCDDSRPCERCVKKGLADTCTDGARKKAKYLLDDDELLELKKEKERKAALRSGDESYDQSHDERGRSMSEAGDASMQQDHPANVPMSFVAAPMPSSTWGTPSNLTMANFEPPNGTAQNEMGQFIGPIGEGNIGQQRHTEMYSNGVNDFSPTSGHSGGIQNVFGSENASLEYSILSSMLNGIDPTWLSGSPENQTGPSNSTPDNHGMSDVYQNASAFSHMGIDSMPWQFSNQQTSSNNIPSWRDPARTPGTSQPYPDSSSQAVEPLHHLDATNAMGGAATPAADGVAAYDALEVPSPKDGSQSHNPMDAVGRAVLDAKQHGHALANASEQDVQASKAAAAAAAAGLDHKPDAVWKERVKHIYGDKTRPFPYTEGYHFLIKYATANLEKAEVLRIVRSLAIFRPSLIALQMPLTEDDEVFVERSIQRTILEFEKLISFSGTPTVVWRRTCEIVVVGNEFSMLSQWSKEYLMGRYIYEFFDKPSILEYWEKFALHAFENTAQSIMMPVTLKTSTGQTTKCAACFSIKRDIFDLPSLIVGNFLPILS